MPKDLFLSLKDSLRQRIDTIRIPEQRRQELEALYDDYFELWEQGRPHEFEFYSAIEKVLHNVMPADRPIQRALNALSTKENFVSFFQTYYDAILENHAGRKAAKRRVAGGKEPFIRAVMEKVREARAPSRRGILDRRYGYLIAKATELANDRFDSWGDRHVLDMARVLLEDDGATSEGSSPYFSEEAMEIIEEAQKFLDGTLDWGLALGVTQNSPPERIVLAAEKHRKSAARFREEAERFTLFLRREHPNQDTIEKLAHQNRLTLDNLERWLEVKRDYPTAFRVEKAV